MTLEKAVAIFVTIANLNSRWLESKRGPVVAEMTALPTVPRPLPICHTVTIFVLTNIPRHNWTCGLGTSVLGKVISLSSTYPTSDLGPSRLLHEHP